MDTAQWPQEIVVKPIEEIVTNTYPKSGDSIERKLTRPTQKDQQALNCPRCNSINTKFCYYNNYSLTQPRYFCKTCRRYWTEGGSLRNIPVGGGSRKNKRSSLSSSSSSSSTSKSTRLPDLVHPVTHTQNHKINQPPQDLNLAFSAPNSQDHQLKNIMTDLIQVPHNIEKNNISPSSTSNTTSQLSALELITTGLTSRGAFNSFMTMSVPDPNCAVYNTTGFPLVSEFKPTLNFSLDGLTSGYGNAQETNGRQLFPFENLKQFHDQHNNKEQGGEPTGYWTGMFGGGSCGLYVKLEYCDQPPHALI